jgi:hypothetical protein
VTHEGSSDPARLTSMRNDVSHGASIALLLSPRKRLCQRPRIASICSASLRVRARTFGRPSNTRGGPAFAASRYSATSARVLPPVK